MHKQKKSEWKWKLNDVAFVQIPYTILHYITTNATMYLMTFSLVT